MKTDNGWNRLAAAARRAPAARDEAAPPGFATRVAALAMSARRRPERLADLLSLRISLRVLGAAATLAVAAAGAGYPAAAKLFAGSPAPTASHVSRAAAPAQPVAAPDATPSTAMPGDDPVAELAEIVS